MSDSGMGAPRDPAQQPENDPGAIREGDENRRREDALAHPDRDFAREQIDITEIDITGSEAPDLSAGHDIDTGAPTYGEIPAAPETGREGTDAASPSSVGGSGSSVGDPGSSVGGSGSSVGDPGSPVGNPGAEPHGSGPRGPAGETGASETSADETGAGETV